MQMKGASVMGMLMMSDGDSPVQARESGLPRCVYFALAAALLCHVVSDRLTTYYRHLPCTSQASATQVKSAYYCDTCQSLDGARGLVVTYRYKVAGVTYTLDHVIEYLPMHVERLELFWSLHPTKVCYQPGNPRNAFLAGPGYRCGDE
jgi:hypothetical protein